MTLQAMIGLECHVQLKTDSKLFCSCPTRKETEEPNSACCEICLGMPGSKPVLNKKALDFALKVALAFNCKINEKFFFSRKTYFYPDMSKNFQITQYEIPIGSQGFVELSSGKKIRIRRIHLEEDPAALVHEAGLLSSSHCLVDYNRSGIPLIEIVTDPDLSSPQEAREFLDELTMVLSYLDVFDFESGTLKADCNLSIAGNERVEIKNVTGKRNVEKALESEAKRQSELVKQGKKIERETRGFDEKTFSTKPLRKKETEDDYGYIFEPDLTGFELTKKQIEDARKSLPELHYNKAKRLVEELGISAEYAKVISGSVTLGKTYEEFAKKVDPKSAAFLVSGIFVTIAHHENKDPDEILNSLSSEQRAQSTETLRLLAAGKITEKTLKEAIIAQVTKGKNPIDFVKENKLLTDLGYSDIEKIVSKVLSANPKAVADLKTGNEKSLNFLVGLVARESKGRAEPRIVKKIIEDRVK